MSSDSTPNHPIAADQQLMISELKNQLARYEQALAAPNQGSADDDLIDLHEVWNMLLRRRWTVLITLVVVLLGTVITTAMMTPIFRATTVLQIERDAGKVVEYQGVTSEESSGSRDFYQTQYELLQSRTLARRVIDQVGLRESGAITQGDEEPSFIAGMVGSVKGLLSGPQEAPEDALPADLESVFLANLSVAPISNSRLVRLYYESPDPREAALVANAIASSFVDMSLERRFEASAYAKGFLEERLKQVRADLEDSERAMIG